MLKYLKNFKKNIEELSPENYSVLLVVPVILYIIGFLVLNFYLYIFGFQVDGLFRGRYIIVGFLFVVISIAVYLFVVFLGRCFKYLLFLSNKYLHGCDFYEVDNMVSNRRYRNDVVQKHETVKMFFGFVLWMWIYITCFFPILPSAIGGGLPRAVLLTVDEHNMHIINSLGVNKAAGADYQTSNVCVVHEDENAIYVLQKNRFLVFKKDSLVGFSTLFDARSLTEVDCARLTRAWISEAVKFNFFSTFANFENLVNDMTGSDLGYGRRMLEKLVKGLADKVNK